MAATVTVPFSERPASLIPRWEYSIDLASGKVTNRERFYWTLIARICMEEIIFHPIDLDAFSGYLGSGDPEIVSCILAGIRKDVMALDGRRRLIVMKQLIAHLVQKVNHP